jgi:hypothetical protein
LISLLGFYAFLRKFLGGAEGECKCSLAWSCVWITVQLELDQWDITAFSEPALAAFIAPSRRFNIEGKFHLGFNDWPE